MEWKCQSGFIKSGSSVTVDVLANDAAGEITSSLDPSSLRVSENINEQPKNGIAVVNPDGTITYTPNPGFIGKDSLRYYVNENDNPSNSGSAWVVYEVLPVNGLNTVVANNDYYFTEGQISGNVLLNDTDPENNNIVVVEVRELSVASSINAKIGLENSGATMTIEPNGEFVFKPKSGFTGTYQYVYTIEDDHTNKARSSATITIVVQSIITLPIVIERFDVVKKDDKIQLTWKSSVEELASYYGIERSEDGVHFKEIAQVPATKAAEYIYNDVYAFSGKLYYKLKLVDLDQSYKYSAVKVVENTNSFKMKVHPNPAINQKAYLNVGGFAGKATVLIYDVTGKKISQAPLTVQVNSTVELPILPSQKGIYYLVVIDQNGNKILQEKLVQQ